MPYTSKELKRKSRDVLLGTVYRFTQSAALSGDKWVYNPPNSNLTPVYGKQVTASEGHPWGRDERFEGDDIGGPFESTSRYFSYEKFARQQESHMFERGMKLENGQGPASVKYFHQSPFFPVSPTSRQIFPPEDPSSDEILMALGTTAIARVKPTNSVADLSVSLAELFREGLPKSPGRSLWEDRARVARGAGSEYLNAQFGWLPLVSDVKDVMTAISESEKIWKQYKRDSGRLVRRRYEFPTLYPDPVLIAEESGRYPSPTPNTRFFESGWAGGQLTHTRYTRKRRWFSGAFTYYVPDRRDSSGVEMLFQHATKARKLYGLTLDPEVLWNLTPWSWAADWFANTGDVISNLSDMATDGLVLRYGYMMEETIVSDEYTLRDIKWSSTPLPARNLTFYANTKTLKRVRATPYGFGLTFEGFSPRQLAILAALGITRGK